MVILFGKWFEIDIVFGVYKLVRFGLLALCYGHTSKPKGYFDAYKSDGSYYLCGFGREVMISTNG